MAFGRTAAIAARVAVAVAAVAAAGAAAAQPAAVERGRYLAAVGGCGDCHTPGHFLGKPDASRALGGSEVGFHIPGLGVFHGPNLTPDKETGLGNWTDAQIVAAITRGRRPDGRQLAPAMPYPALAALTPADAKAIVAYLRSLPPVRNKVPGPFGPNDKPAAFVLAVLPADAFAALPKPPPPAK
jgi:mono/diheme cytochrome c family protein